ncbi:MAG: hypothetical protein RLZZ546_2763 [Bacteroidota bacterium]|jgi:hypothetical protein
MFFWSSFYTKFLKAGSQGYKKVSLAGSLFIWIVNLTVIIYVVLLAVLWNCSISNKF